MNLPVSMFPATGRAAAPVGIALAVLIGLAVYMSRKPAAITGKSAAQQPIGTMGSTTGAPLFR